MIKKISTVFFMLLLSASVFAQKNKPVAPVLPMDAEGKLVVYTGVVEETGIMKSELFKRAQLWTKEFYPSATAVQSADTTAMKIICKGKFDCKREVKGSQPVTSDRIIYTLTISFKDMKYKYEVSNILVQGSTSTSIEKYFDDADPKAEDHFNSLTQVDENIIALVNSLKTRMDKPSVVEKKDEW